MPIERTTKKVLVKFVEIWMFVPIFNVLYAYSVKFLVRQDKKKARLCIEGPVMKVFDSL